jgi:hypothetical protein
VDILHEPPEGSPFEPVSACNLKNINISKRSKTMKKSSIISSLVLLVAAMMLSGCLFPYWEDEGGGHRGGGHHEGGRGDGGHREGGERH